MSSAKHAKKPTCGYIFCDTCIGYEEQEEKARQQMLNEEKKLPALPIPDYYKRFNLVFKLTFGQKDGFYQVFNREARDWSMMQGMLMLSSKQQEICFLERILQWMFSYIKQYNLIKEFDTMIVYVEMNIKEFVFAESVAEYKKQIFG